MNMHNRRYFFAAAALLLVASPAFGQMPGRKTVTVAPSTENPPGMRELAGGPDSYAASYRADVEYVRRGERALRLQILETVRRRFLVSRSRRNGSGRSSFTCRALPGCRRTCMTRFPSCPNSLTMATSSRVSSIVRRRGHRAGTDSGRQDGDPLPARERGPLRHRSRPSRNLG